jgi:predicted DNA-binding protein (UPF0251 family)
VLEKLKIITALQYGFYGNPSIFYGDEVGIREDPPDFSRKCFPWGNENQEILEWYKFLGELRKREVFKSGKMDALKAEDGKVVATIYCGDAFFAENEEEVTRKVIGMTKKINPDVVICGPAFNYKGYASMSAKLAKAIEENTEIPTVAAMSQENDETIAEYKDKVNYLNQARHLRKKIQALKNLKQDNKMLSGMSYENTGAKNCNNYNNTECKMFRIVDMSIKIDEEIQRLERLTDEIFTVICNLDDDELETILIYRFLQFMTIGNIAKEMHYDEKTVSRKLHKAIEKIVL